MDEAGASIKGERAKNIPARRGALAAADPGISDFLVAIAARAAKFEAKRSGECRLRPAGVGGGVAAPVAQGRAPGAPSAGAFQEHGGDGDPEDGQAGGKEIRDIIEFGGGVAEGGMARRQVADHAVGCIDRLVADAAGKTASSQPERRRDDPVGKILGEALDRRPGDARCIQSADVAPDNGGDRGAAGLQPAMLKRQRHGADMRMEAALRDQARSDKRKQAQRDRIRQGQVNDEGADDECRAPGGGQYEAKRGRAQNAPLRERPVLAIEAPVAIRDQGADPADRMAERRIKRGWVANHGLDRYSKDGQLKMRGETHGSKSGGSGEGGKALKHDRGRIDRLSEEASQLSGNTERATDLIPGHDAGRQAHGGDLSAARQAFPCAPEPWLDLSTGVNPYCYPFSPPSAESSTRLPDAPGLAALEAAARTAYGASRDAEIVAAPGTQAIINWLPHLFPARRVGILGFTYFEHFSAWRASGAATSIVNDLDGFGDKDVGVIVNPNNPDGRLIARDDLRGLAESFRERGKLLIIDEAFADFLEPGVSLAPELPRSGALVLRSFGKTFGLPGLRLGFAIAPRDMALKLRAAFGCWPISGAAIAIGAQALADSPWFEAARERLKGDAAALDAILKSAGFELYGGSPLFRLAAAPDAGRRFKALAGAGIWVRRFDARPDWLRLAIPGRESDRDRLRRALGVEAPNVVEAL